jgi:hypothetical protein
MYAVCGVQGQENQKLMSTPGIKDRIGNVGNQVMLCDASYMPRLQRRGTAT